MIEFPHQQSCPFSTPKKEKVGKQNVAHASMELLLWFNRPRPESARDSELSEKQPKSVNWKGNKPAVPKREVALMPPQDSEEFPAQTKSHCELET